MTRNTIYYRKLNKLYHELKDIKDEAYHLGWKSGIHINKILSNSKYFRYCELIGMINGMRIGRSYTKTEVKK